MSNNNIKYKIEVIWDSKVNANKVVDKLQNLY